MRQSRCVRILTTVTEHLQTWPRHNACLYPCHWLERPNNNLQLTTWDFIMENMRHTSIWRAVYHTLHAGFWRKIGFRNCFFFRLFLFFLMLQGTVQPKIKKWIFFLLPVAPIWKTAFSPSRNRERVTESHQQTLFWPFNVRNIFAYGATPAKQFTEPADITAQPRRKPLMCTSNGVTSTSSIHEYIHAFE